MRSVRANMLTALFAASLAFAAPVEAIAQATPSPGQVQKIDANLNRLVGQTADLTTTLISQYDAAKKAAEVAKSSASTISDLQGTIETLTKLKNSLKYFGYAMFIVDFALAFVPEQDKTYKLLQGVDQRVALLDAKLDAAVFEIIANTELVNGIGEIRKIAGQYSSTFYTMGQYLSQASAARGAGSPSPLGAYFVGMPRGSAAASAGEIAGYCKNFINQRDIFTVLSDATNGSTPDVTAMGTKILLLLTQLQRVDTYDTYSRNEEYKRLWPDEPARKEAAAKGVSDIFNAYFSDCTDAMVAALQRLNKDDVIRDYVTKIFNKHKATVGGSAFPGYLGAVLKQNFPHKDWTLISYDDVGGFDNHEWTTWSGAANVSFRRADNNFDKAIIIVWADPEPFASVDDRWITCRNRWPAGPSGIYAEQGTVPAPNLALAEFIKDDVSKASLLYCSDLPSDARSFAWFGNRSTVNNLVTWSSNTTRTSSDAVTPATWKCTYGQHVFRQFYCPPFTVVMLGRPGFKDQQVRLIQWPANRLYLEGGRLLVGPNPAQEASGRWDFEPAAPGYYRIKNSSGIYLHLEHQTGAPEFGAVQPGWYSAMWEVLPLYRKTVDVPGSGKSASVVILLRNRWTQQYVAMANGGGLYLTNSDTSPFAWWLIPGFQWTSNTLDNLKSLD